MWPRPAAAIPSPPTQRSFLASGAAVPISRLIPSEKVLATNTKGGKTQAEPVAAVLVHHDTDLYDLTIKTRHGTAVIHTTSSHLFWDPSLDHGWIPANHLKPGAHLRTPDGQTAVVVGGSVPAAHDGWMWDLTVPGNNDHDFYVSVAATAVLVHNDSCPSIGARMRAAGPGDEFGLPNQGRIRYVPPRGYNPENPLPRGPQGGSVNTTV